MSYDIIGDIHGCAHSLQLLLDRLEYSVRDGAYRHPERRVIFLGDFIDRGPLQRETIEMVRRMVDAGAALSVMGNHEFNALAYYTPDRESGDYLRPHTEKNMRQHQAFLDAYAHTLDDYAEVIAWFMTLPLWLDLGGLRIVHACWDARLIAKIAVSQGGSHLLGEELLVQASHRGQWQYEALETLLKGKEIRLPDGVSFRDKDGTSRHNIRVRWWDQGATNFKDAFFGPESARTHIPDDEIAGDHLVDYSHEAPPVFLGHYWMEGDPAPLARNIACLDYSVAKPGGRLTAYRWDGEQVLETERFVWVDRVEGGS
jgi:Calcineurin-like phosphoesterase